MRLFMLKHVAYMYAKNRQFSSNFYPLSRSNVLLLISRSYNIIRRYVFFVYSTSLFFTFLPMCLMVDRPNQTKLAGAKSSASIHVEARSLHEGGVGISSLLTIL